MSIPRRISSPAMDGLDRMLASDGPLAIDEDELASLQRLSMALLALVHIQAKGGEQGRIALDALKKMGEVK